jgi:PPOX class probable F420-dependent enzyme
MTFQLPDDSTLFGTNVRRRVHEEYLMWLTAVDIHGTPQPAPVWFLWDEDASNFLIYNQTHAKRLDFVRRNSQVALHFDGYGTGSGIIVFTGHAQISTSEPLIDRTFPFEQVVEAQRYQVESRPFGKVLLTFG